MRALRASIGGENAPCVEIERREAEIAKLQQVPVPG
jgi:hypothetical protein